MLNLSCLCGEVHVAIEAHPGFINECNCALCSKTGARWSYFDPSQVRVAGETQGYVREDKTDPSAQVHFCGRCGATTHFVLTPAAQARFGNTMMGVNMRLAEEPALAGIELRYPDGQSWSGEGDFGFVRSSRILGQPD